MKTEIWKDMIGYEGLYQVSSLGRVRSLSRISEDKNGKVISVKGKIRKQYSFKNGYNVVRLSKNGKTLTVSCHRKIAEAFLPNPEKLPQVNHINGNKNDNRIENLEWVTISENVKHGYRIGHSDKKGEKHHSNKLKESDVFEIRRLLSDGLSCKEISYMYNVHRVTINYIKLRKSWKHI